MDTLIIRINFSSLKTGYLKKKYACLPEKNLPFSAFFSFQPKKASTTRGFFWFLVDGLVEHLSEFIFVVRAERIQLGHENSY